MTSTTKWRGRSPESNIDQPFPRRPSLSPIPFSSSPEHNPHTWQAESYQQGEHQIRGLGLSGTSVALDHTEIAQPNRLYIDQNGGAHVIAAQSRSKHKHNARGGLHAGARPSGRNPKSNKRKNHTRSGSTIDDLADAAIATSPRFAAVSPTHALTQSPSAFSHARPATSHINGHGYGEAVFDRPAKRVRSEWFYSTESTSHDGRPRTSHTSEYQSPRPEEAELLLGLRYAWGAQASPSIPPVSLNPDTQHEQIIPPADPSLVQNNTTESSNATVEPNANGVASAEDETPVNVDDNKIDRKDALRESQVHMGLPESGEVDSTLATEVQSERPYQDIDNTVQSADKKEGKAAGQTASLPPQPTKKPRKIQPEVQAEVCAACLKLQRDGSDEDNTTQWIGCEHCKQWFHTACAGFKDKQEARSVDKYYCKGCEGSHGTTTFVRKSSRARTAIDYAGLNEGVIKPSDESSMHHYIQPIKDGRLKYQSDDFARVRPELMNADFWESMDGMKRPFVVPACWNPRFGNPSTSDETTIDSINAESVVHDHEIWFDDSGEEISNMPPSKHAANASKSSAADGVEVVDTDQDYLDMVMPRHLTVCRVAELYGPEQPVPVIDVKSQETKGQFTLADWATYYEQQGDKPIRNVISLEVSNSRLGRLIRRPRVVRDIDLEDCVWDNESRSTSNKRPVQFYCLMSVADSYTDFHIDFGGSSVYYHILKGVKTFFFIPPEDRYLKKYEEWCNSDTQNETWLGDLCGGNVTRVDLYEGDTAFIPAGWIHSVWTPEDSLVIGGNFLTRLDYELQFKVANIEKTTRVPQKFRYPFFQKVMWFSLLKYLDDDPVPEEVIRSFHEDEEYRYIRANPIYMDPDDLIKTAEPGTCEFNARIYAKTELKGLPSLRDYLYRTARIHADLAVPDINKRQIDAVKASIPKGHGDPLQLIKTFAVWCAWKMGNEKVPDWVHTDADGLSPELKEREKMRKAEAIRAPPERVSTRKVKDQPNSPLPSTPTSPDQKPVRSPDSDDSAKKRNEAKLSASRVACEPCRKRRIKCRHKEEESSPSSTSPAAIRPRTYSNVSIDIPKLPPASPATNSHEQTPMPNGTGLDVNNSDLAQAALATLQSQSVDATPQVLLATPGGSMKKGRSKACEECRKSKRRCVHDEYGRVDPAKAAEPSKPRGSATTKRAARISDENPVRKLKLEAEIDPALIALSQPEVTDAMIDPALMGEGFGAVSSEGHYGHIFELDPAMGVHQEDFVHQTADGGYGELSQHAISGELPMLHSENWNTGHAAVETDISPAPPGTHVNTAILPARRTSYSPISGEPEMLAGQVNAYSNDLIDPRLAPQQSTDMSGTVKPYLPPGDASDAEEDARRASSENSGRTGISTMKSRRSSSNTSNTTHRTTAALVKPAPTHESPGRPVSRDSAVISEADADEKLARELQAAENGLRRRTSVRA